MMLLAFFLYAASATHVFVHMAYSASHRPSSHLEYFLTHAILTHSDPLVKIHFFLSISGRCSFSVCEEPEIFVRDRKANLTVFRRTNFGFDFGSHGEALRKADWKGYDKFIFLNSGVTGPFLPVYSPASFHWSDAFCEKLGGRVRMVGTTIACLPSSDLGGKGPKVEGFAFAADRLGVEILFDSTAFDQHRNKVDAIVNGEYAASTAIFKSGFSIDCLLLAYTGRKWKRLDECNSMIHPSRRGTYFGGTINPVEVIFHKSHWDGEQPVAKEQVDERLYDITAPKPTTQSSSPQNIFVHVAYNEASNRPSWHLEFLLRVASKPRKNSKMEFVLSVVGDCRFEVCKHPESFVDDSTSIVVRNASSRKLGGHNLLTFHHADAWDFVSEKKFDHFIFLSNEAVGPFHPNYMPKDWHWSDAITSQQVLLGKDESFVSTPSLDLLLQEKPRTLCHTANIFDCLFVKGFSMQDETRTELEDVVRYGKWNDVARSPFISHERSANVLCVVIRKVFVEDTLKQFVYHLQAMSQNMVKLRVNVCTRKNLPEIVIDFPFLSKIEPPLDVSGEYAELDYCIDQCLDDSTHLLVTDQSFRYEKSLWREVEHVSEMIRFDVLGLTSRSSVGGSSSCVTFDFDRPNKELGFLLWNIESFKNDFLRFSVKQ
jgi:hypothetical protein